MNYLAAEPFEVSKQNYTSFEAEFHGTNSIEIRSASGVE
jgi:hypothetical protein